MMFTNLAYYKCLIPWNEISCAFLYWLLKLTLRTQYCLSVAVSCCNCNLWALKCVYEVIKLHSKHVVWATEYYSSDKKLMNTVHQDCYRCKQVSWAVWNGLVITVSMVILSCDFKIWANSYVVCDSGTITKSFILL